MVGVVAMVDKVDLYDGTYGERDDVLAQTRRETSVSTLGRTAGSMSPTSTRMPGGCG
jgi:hypothetical protein